MSPLRLGGPGGCTTARARPSFITWRLAAGQKCLAPRERDIVAHTLRRGDGRRYQLVAFVVMDDHVHVLARPGEWTLERTVDSWMSSAAQQLERISGRRGTIWQPRARRQVLRTEDQARALAYYVIGNPWKRWPFLRGYPWVWERDQGRD